MRFLLDEMYTGLKDYLEALGWDIETVNSVGLKSAEDNKIIEYAKENKLIVITQDEKLADIANIKQVQCVFISKTKLAKMIDTELRKNN